MPHTASLRRPLLLLCLTAAALLASACSGTSGTDPVETDTTLDTAVSDATDDTAVDAADTADTAQPDMTTSCTAPAAECDGDPATACETDLDSSAAHCGACDNACNAGSVCSAGTCAASCASGTVDCDGACINTDISLDHCGGCNQPCVAGSHAAASCMQGTCTVTCDDNFADCDGDQSNGCEIDLRTDLAHCGTCGASCDAAAHAGATCESGVCTRTCDAGYGDCDGDGGNGCEMNLDNNLHCGACGATCGAVTNGTSTCTDRVCRVVACDPNTFDADGDAANGCEFTAVRNPAPDASLLAPPNGRPAIGVRTADNTTRIISLDVAISPVRMLSVTPGDALSSGSELIPPMQPGVWLTAAATDDISVGLDHRAFGLAGIDGGTYGGIHTYCAECTNDATIAPPEARVVGLQPMDEAEPQPHLFIRTQNGALEWHAYSRALYGYDTNETDCVLGTMLAWTICPVYDLVLTGESIVGFDLFELGGSHFVAVAVDDNAGSPLGVDVYRIDLNAVSLQQVNGGGRIDTGLAAASTPPIVDFVPGDSETHPGLVIASGAHVTVLRFTGPTEPTAATIETQIITSSGEVVDVVALDARTMLASTSGGGGEVQVFGSSPDVSAGIMTTVRQYSSGSVGYLLTDPVTAGRVYVQRGGRMEAFDWTRVSP